MTKRITFQVSDATYERLLEESRRSGLTLAALVRDRVDENAKMTSLQRRWDGSERKTRKVRLSDGEYETLSQNAERFGLSRSAYVRSRCVYRPGTYVEVDRELLADCFRELRRQGVNLNQIAKEINTAARVARAADAVIRLRPEIEACLKEISAATRRFKHVMLGVEHNGYK